MILKHSSRVCNCSPEINNRQRGEAVKILFDDIPLFAPAMKQTGNVTSGRLLSNDGKVLVLVKHTHTAPFFFGYSVIKNCFYHNICKDS